jgi:hypothetical protein
MMEPDPVIEEIHAIREALSAASGDDIRRIAEAARVRQAQSGRPAVTLRPRVVKTVPKAS